jgi:hypothetical protein
MRQRSRLSVAHFVFLTVSLGAAALHAEDGKVGAIGADEPLRQWSDTTGRYQIDATLIDYRDGKVELRRFDGKRLTVSLSRLSRTDRDYVRRALSKKEKKDEAERPPAESSAASVLDADIPDAKTAESSESATGGRPERRVGLPDPDCPVCRGLGLVPPERFSPYVHVEGQPTPDATESICGRYCPECQGGKSLDTLLAVETERLKTAPERHEEWEKELQMRLTRIETHSIVIHAQVPLAEARRVAMAMEALTHHLQQLTGNLVLTPRRPATDDLFLFVDKPSYLRLTALLKEEPRYSRVNFDLLERLSGGSLDRITFLQRTAGGVPLENMAVHGSAYRQIQIASRRGARPWLCDGFAAYCEFAVTRQNLMHTIDAQSVDVRLASNWELLLRQLARTSGVRTWDEMFKKELAEFETIHYLEAKSVVGFLLREPDKFQDYLEQVAVGVEDGEALAEAYGKPVKELETEWRRTLGLRR